jgi:hypothetical protein
LLLSILDPRPAKAHSVSIRRKEEVNEDIPALSPVILGLDPGIHL